MYAIVAWWFNPRQNASQLIGKFPQSPQRTFTPPTHGRNNDWVLVIDDADRDPARLGSSHQHLTPLIRE